MTVAELRRRMSQAEFIEWITFYRIEQEEREKEEKKSADEMKRNAPRGRR